MKSLVYGCILSFLILGCASEPRIVEKPDDMVNTFSMQDITLWDRAAEQVTGQLSSRIAPTEGRKALVFVSHFINNTGDPNLHIPVLTDKIVAKLSESGQIVAMVDDPVARQLAEKNALLGKGPKPQEPDYTLAGRITRLEVNEGRKRQMTYIFNVTLNDTKTATIAYQGRMEVTKGGSRAGIGL